MWRAFRQLCRGLYSFLRGVKWLRHHPLMLGLLFLPMMLGLTLLVAGWSLFYGYQELVFEWILFSPPESWWGLGFYYLIKGILWLAVFLSGLIFYALLISILSSPVYDYVSLVVERSVTGGPAAEISFMDSVRLMGEEAKKALFILTLSFGILMIPGLNLLTPVVTAFCVGWEVYDFPLARRGWSFRQRLRFVWQHGCSVSGLGFWLLIPGLQFILMPLAVVGASLLATEDIKKWQLLTSQTEKDHAHGSR